MHRLFKELGCLREESNACDVIVMKVVEDEMAE